MSNLFQNMIVLGFCWLLATGGGVYLTYFKQPSELERLENADKVARMKEAELTSLMSEMDESSAISNEIVSRWNSRYKVVPNTLGAEDVILFLNQHTERGFDPFDITLREVKSGSEYNTYVFAISGKGYFHNLYKLIWALENSRQMFRINDLELDHMNLMTTDRSTKKQRLDIVVDFTFQLEAFYGGLVGQRIAEAEEGMTDGRIGFPEFPGDNSLPVPDEVLPRRNPPLNPFYPLIMDQIQPNTHNMVDVESASLVGIANGEAKFAWDGKFVSLRVGDPIYLGQIISVDPEKGSVTARLNKGGIIDRVEVRVGATGSSDDENDSPDQN